MRWEDERYVRLYTRDTATWKLLPWQAKALLPLLLRKLDRAGVVDLGDDDPHEAVAALTDMPVELVAVGLPEILKRKSLVLIGSQLCMPKFIEAQEAHQSDAARKRAQRERDRARVLTPPPDDGHTAVTPCDGPSHGVTVSHEVSRAVTPFLAVPNQEGSPERASAHEPPPTPVPCRTLERPNSVDGDEALYALRRGSNGKIGAMASAGQLAALATVARTAQPRPLTAADFELLGRAYAAGEALGWCRYAPDVGQLLANDAKMLIEGMTSALAWAERQRPAPPPVRIVPALAEPAVEVTAEQIAAANPFRRRRVADA